jgi:4-amino-4-deoxy-L-arabinose transferase-like glycosyltransferase
MRTRIPASSRQDLICRWLEIMDRHARTLVLGIIVLVFVAGLGYSIYLGDSLRYADEQMYYSLARNLHEHSTFSLHGDIPTAVQAPGYPFSLMLVMLVSDSVVAMRALNFLAFCVSLWLLYLLVQKHSRAGVGLFGVLLCVGYPVFFYTASTLFPQTIGATLFMTILYLADRSSRLTAWTGICLGLLFGSLILTIPSFVALLAVFIAWRLVCTHAWPILLCVLFVVLLVNLPWAVRNHQLFQKPVFVTTVSGINLILGNSENTTANAGVNTDVSKYSQIVSQERLNEAEADQFYKEQALRWILDHKVDAIQLYLLKFVNHFNFRNELYTVSESSFWRDLLAAVTYLPLLALLVARAGTFRVLPMTRFEWFLILLYISWGLTMAIFFTRVRFRLPLDFVLVLVDALFLYQLGKRVVLRLKNL